MRRLIGAAVLTALLLVPSTVSADTAPFLVATAPDAAGCTGLEVHGYQGLVLTLAPWDGSDGGGNVRCARVGRQFYVPLVGYSRLVFTWQRWECCNGPSPILTTYVWETDGDLDSTHMIRHVYCPGQHGIDVVNRFVLVREVCGLPHRWLASALETDLGPLPGMFPATGGDVDRLQMPLYMRVRQRIAYAASGPDLHNRELWVSDRNFDGQSMTMVDIWPGHRSSNPHGFVSHGTFVTFVADDGHGAALWRTDGTLAGTYKVNH